MLTSTIQLGDPVEHRGVVVAPLFPRRQPVAEYLTLEDALPLGFRVTEQGDGLVPELRAVNPLGRDVLLYDGEELLGARQNRILNVTVLVAAGTEAAIPVSCVEEGRWHARSAAFSPAPHTAFPALRRRKAEQLSAAPLARGVAQAAVWEDVRAKAGRLGVESPTGAQADVFRGRAATLAAIRDAFPPVPGQCGALLALGGELALDWVSRPDAWARLHPRVLQGYALDALERLDGAAAPEKRLAAFLERLERAPQRRGPSAGRGNDLRLRGEGVVGSGLVLGDELVQLSAFSSEAGEARTRVARPSRRR